jgi:hypothetical protein
MPALPSSGELALELERVAGVGNDHPPGFGRISGQFLA